MPRRVVAGTAVVVCSAVLWLVWAPWSGENDAAGQTRTPGAVSPISDRTTYGADWTSSDGSRYRLSVAPGLRLRRAPSPGGCVPTPLAGKANVTFVLRIENLSSRTAPVPTVEVGANTGPLGAVRPAQLTLERSSRRVELFPLGAGQGCELAATAGPEGRPWIPAKGAVTLEGTVGGVDPGPSGAAPGLSLIVRYHQADPRAPEGSSAQELLAPFALAPVV